MSNLTGRVALVTGGGRDVGAEICRVLAAAGAKVAVNYNASKAEAEAVVAEIRRRAAPPRPIRRTWQISNR
jgi:NAD(P)-dependent dehydrogenase (short-subunit alcohol dehydrogenase family)